MQRHAQLHGTRPPYHHHLELAVILTQHPQILDTEEELLWKLLEEFTVDDEYFVWQCCMTNLTYKNGIWPGVVTNLNVAEWKQRTGARMTRMAVWPLHTSASETLVCGRSTTSLCRAITRALRTTPSTSTSSPGQAVTPTMRITTGPSSS